MKALSSPAFLAPRVLRRAGTLLVAIGAAAVAACDDPYAPEGFRVVGALDLGKQVQMPDTMTAGVPSEIVFWTHGRCITGGETEVDIAGRSALVIPYDYLGGAEAVGCGILLTHWFEHKAEVVFDDPGTAEITISYSSDGVYLRRYGYKVYTVEVVR